MNSEQVCLESLAERLVGDSAVGRELVQTMAVPKQRVVTLSWDLCLLLASAVPGVQLG